MFPFREQASPYPITRNAMYAQNGMVATSQPLASQAGLDILKKGGNAIDAAIATAACLTVVEPTSNGIGSDAFALVWTKDGSLHGLNGSGKAPQSISIDKVKREGYERMPKYGWKPVTVPGAPGTWAELSSQYGNLPLRDVLAPAIDHAANGFPLTPTLGAYWKKAYWNFKEQLEDDAVFEAWFETFAPKGRAPEVGEVWASADHARTLELIGRTQAESFYRGELAEEIAAFSERTGGYLTKEDLAAYEPEWVDPIRAEYRGYDVWELPPNGQGVVALEALNILQGFEFSNKEAVDTYHKQIEAVKLAFADAFRYVTDPAHMRLRPEALVDPAYAEARRALITDAARQPEAGAPSGSGTVYLAAADGEGNMVSFVQSNYMGFGSGLVVPGTGIALQNRGYDFSLDPAHANALAGGKRTYHTLIPGFLTKDGEAVGPFGVMGGLMMPQGHVQLLTNTLDFGLDPQAALDAPRWQWIKDKRVTFEPRFGHHTAQELAKRGHDASIAMEPNSFGRGQIIWRDPVTGVLAGGTESRTDGSIAAW